MPYVLPTFNLECNIWFNPGTIPETLPPDLVTECQLRYPGRGPISIDLDGMSNWGMSMHLLLPAMTPIRDQWCENGPSLVEVPAGSGRLYESNYVDDVAKGFDNEHRIAWLTKVGVWPDIIP